MTTNSEIIKTEIIRILNENGKTRGTELVKRAIKKVGNEKMIYREISALVEAGQIEKKMYDRKHIEYELINLSESANRQLKSIHKEITITFDEIKKFYSITEQSKIEFHKRIRTILQLIHRIQSRESIMRLLSYYPTFKKDKMFSQINRKVSDCWETIMIYVTHQPEEEFLNEVLANLRITHLNSKIVN